jgi:CHAD domain-containing protein
LRDIEAVLDAPPEKARPVHRARVATRRLQALLRILRRYGKRRAFRRHGRTLSSVRRSVGAVRDLDVQRDLVITLLRGRDVPSRRLLLTMQRRRKRAHEEARRALTDPETVLAMEVLRRFLREGGGLRPRTVTPRRARRVLRRAQREVDRRLAFAEQEPSMENLHELRIALKRQRYQVELLGAVAGSDGAVPEESDGRRVAILTRLQDLLGASHDADVLAGEIAALPRGRGGPGDRTIELLVRSAIARARRRAGAALALLRSLSATSSPDARPSPPSSLPGTSEALPSPRG